ncbi:hypothetical protein BCR34DRAFT_487852 [Clohesyomyces aquaticus]|uniref:Uncharacterized protein n=1 Tax=Clohesyomyces aquaticus TaxID=1231657 RepID=A0A1Y1ZFR0_9PLEO|nr:hypothetical protein BCR34DRAFT_487852 [Clohesyomyces aquaticus]
MKPGALSIRARARPMCQLCDYMLQQPARQRRFVATSTFKAPAPSVRRQLPRPHGVVPAIRARTSTTAAQATPQTQELEPEQLSQVQSRIEQVNSRLRDIEEFINAIFTSHTIEEGDQRTVHALEELQAIADQAINIRISQLKQTRKSSPKASSAAAILSLDVHKPSHGNGNSNGHKSSPAANTLPSPTYIQQLAESLLRHENVFLSPNALSAYIDLVKLIHRPRSIPDMFRLYATKPIPLAGTSPPRFSHPSPSSHKQAIPGPIAEKALSAAIAAKDLVLCLDVVDTTYCAPAFIRHKIVSKALPPVCGAALLPFGLWIIAEEFSHYSGGIDPALFKMYSWVGLLTYVSCTGTLGFVALTTHNDHFDRVVWRPGMPLRDRWLREEERAAMDRIAGAWGFKEKWRRGDEEGEEWEGLKEFIALRGMWLDKPDLMEGQNPGGEYGMWKMNESLFSLLRKKWKRS